MTYITPINAPKAAATGISVFRERMVVRACTMSWILVAAAVPIAAAVLLASGMQLVIASFLPLVATTVVLVITHHVYSRLRPDPRLALTSGLLAVLILSGVLAGVISHAGLRLGFPLIDPWLDLADRTLGIDTPRLALRLALHPGLGEPLDIMYISAFPATFMTALWLGFTGQTLRAWELGLSFAGSILVASIVAMFFPALGNMAYHHIDAVKGLPDGAGSYYLDAFRFFRDGHDPKFDLHRLSGVVEFPSFHTVMALAVPYGLRRSGIAGWVAAAWSALVIVSTIAIGGHYVVDLIGGGLLWAIWVGIARNGWKTRRTSNRHRC